MRILMIILFVVAGLALLLVLLLFHMSAAVRLQADRSGLNATVKLKLLFGLLPLRACVTVCPNGQILLHVPFVSRTTTAQKVLDFLKQRRKKKKRKKKKALLQFLLRGVGIDALRIHIAIGLSDAAACALCCGSLQALLYAALSLISEKMESLPQVCVEPVFNASVLWAELSGIMCFSVEKTIFSRQKKNVQTAVRGAGS